jgi:osmotically-inducible protein OsmY
MIRPGHQDVVSQAKKLLDDSPFPELHAIDVEQRGDKVRLRGEVRTYFLKQIAQETVRSATHGLEVENDLLVDLRRRVH